MKTASDHRPEMWLCCCNAIQTLRNILCCGSASIPSTDALIELFRDAQKLSTDYFESDFPSRIALYEVIWFCTDHLRLKIIKRPSGLEFWLTELGKGGRELRCPLLWMEIERLCHSIGGKVASSDAAERASGGGFGVEEELSRLASLVVEDMKHLCIPPMIRRWLSFPGRHDLLRALHLERILVRGSAKERSLSLNFIRQFRWMTYSDEQRNVIGLDDPSATAALHLIGGSLEVPSVVAVTSPEETLIPTPTEDPSDSVPSTSTVVSSESPFDSAVFQQHFPRWYQLLTYHTTSNLRYWDLMRHDLRLKEDERNLDAIDELRSKSTANSDASCDLHVRLADEREKRFKSSSEVRSREELRAKRAEVCRDLRYEDTNERTLSTQFEIETNIIMRTWKAFSYPVNTNFLLGDPAMLCAFRRDVLALLTMSGGSAFDPSESPIRSADILSALKMLPAPTDSIHGH